RSDTAAPIVVLFRTSLIQVVRIARLARAGRAEAGPANARQIDPEDRATQLTNGKSGDTAAIRVVHRCLEWDPDRPNWSLRPGTRATQRARQPSPRHVRREGTRGAEARGEPVSHGSPAASVERLPRAGIVAQ